MHLTAQDYRRAARRVLPRFVFDFIDGGADDESGMLRNRRDLDALTLTPRVLRVTTSIDTTVELFGSRWKQPLAITPSGFNGLCRVGGDAMLARAAAAAGIPFVVATPSNQRLEALRAAVPDGELWLQLYMLQDRSIATQLLRRAHALGFKALVLTVDVPIGGNRERDLRHGFKLPPSFSLRMALDLALHPRWSMAQVRAGLPNFVNLQEDPAVPASMAAHAALLARTMDRSLDWDDLKRLRDQWPGALVLKGLLHPQDAATAVACGVDAITVSNHGGRQWDCAPSSITALPGVVAAVQGRIPVFVDSGFRRGSDVLKALVLGARAVFLGRPLLYALAADGQAGVQHMLQLLSSEIERGMVLLGATRTAELSSCEVLRGSTGATYDRTAT